MEKPKRYVGFLDFKEQRIPFEFDDKEFLLRMYHLTPEDAKEHSWDFLRLLSEQSSKKHEWVECLDIYATLADDKRVIFNVNDNPSTYCGYDTYRVNWYYCFQDGSDSINGLRVSAKEIEYFFPPQEVYTSSIVCSEDQEKITEMRVVTTGQYDFDFGVFEMEEKVLHLSGHAFATLAGRSANPFEAHSFLLAECEDCLSVRNGVDLAYTIMDFLKYVSYRSNISIFSVDTFRYDEHGTREYIGFLSFPREKSEEKSEKAQKVIIGYDLLKENSTALMQLFCDKVITLQHLCESIETRLHYTTARFILILTAFEREFRNVYGLDFGRSEKYLRVKAEVLDSLNVMRENKHGKCREYVDQIINLIGASDNGYGMKVQKALKCCLDIIEPFIRKKYEGEIEDVINGIGKRMGNCRNGIAHGRLDFLIDPINLDDIKIIEELLYAMRLKSLSIDSTAIQKAINSLFCENMMIK